MFEDIVLPSRESAEAVRTALLRLLKENGVVRVSDYMNLITIMSTYSDERVGWTELDEIPIKAVENWFVLDLPPAKPIDS